MAFAENLAAMFADFGVSATYSAVTAKVILDRETQAMFDQMALGEEESITLPAATFAALASGDAITVDAVAYTVREVRLMDDGKLKRATLRRV
jgi:hypothetical protein